jgi:hypothetical protein
MQKCSVRHIGRSLKIRENENMYNTSNYVTRINNFIEVCILLHM